MCSSRLKRERTDRGIREWANTRALRTFTSVTDRDSWKIPLLFDRLDRDIYRLRVAMINSTSTRNNLYLEEYYGKKLIPSPTIMLKISRKYHDLFSRSEIPERKEIHVMIVSRKSEKSKEGNEIARNHVDDGDQNGRFDERRGQEEERSFWTGRFASSIASNSEAEHGWLRRA